MGRRLFDLLLAEVREVEVDVLAVGALDAAAGLDLLDDRARDHVARAELGLLADAVVVLDEEALALRVLQVAALAARGLGDQDAGAGQPVGWYWTNSMSFSGDARAIGERHAVAGLDGAVRREREDLAGAAGGEDHRAAEDHPHDALADVEGRDAAHRAAVDAAAS